jgi:predicted dehydrogenase
MYPEKAQVEPGMIRVGLIGYGYVGKTFHAPLIRSVSGLALTVVGSSRPDAVHANLPDVEVCSPAEVATHPEVDLVVIASPNDSHCPLATAALLAGKHVVVDKPFTVTLAEARSLALLAKQQNRLLSVFHNRRFESEFLATKSILESGMLGHVSHYECHMDRFRPVVRKRWREDPGPGAGLWFDLGPHMIDQALTFFGLPLSVNANFAILREGGQTDDWAHIQLNYEKLRVILHASILVSGGVARSTLHGTLGSWVKYRPDVQEKQLAAGMSPNDEGFGYDPDPGIFYEGATGEQTEIDVPSGCGPMYYSGVRDAILTGQSAPIPAKDAVAVMAVLEASFESGKQGKTLQIPLTPEERAEWA